MADDVTLVPGTLDLLVLNTLRWGPRHGYNIGRWLKDHSASALILEDRALYLSLHRLDERGWIDSEWGVTENNRHARYYRLTPAGWRQLRAKSDAWQRYATMIADMLCIPATGEGT